MTDRKLKKLLHALGVSALATILAFGAVVAIGLAGATFDGVSRQIDQRQVCQKRAPTPADYHRC